MAGQEEKFCGFSLLFRSISALAACVSTSYPYSFTALVFSSLHPHSYTHSSFFPCTSPCSSLGCALLSLWQKGCISYPCSPQKDTRRLFWEWFFCLQCSVVWKVRLQTLTFLWKYPFLVVLPGVEQQKACVNVQEQTWGWMKPWLAASPVWGPPALK